MKVPTGPYSAPSRHHCKLNKNAGSAGVVCADCLNDRLGLQTEPQKRKKKNKKKKQIIKNGELHAFWSSIQWSSKSPRCLCAGLAYRSGNYRYLPALLHVSRNDTKYQDIN